MDSNDFVKGVDFTGLTEANASDLNQLVDSATTKQDTAASNGKGLVLVTDDSALDTPDVPDAVGTPKWTRYLWARRPHSTSPTTNLIIYGWNENAVSDPTYLQWVEANPVDVAGLEADIAAAQATADNALATANSAAATAGTAQSAANTAVNTANDAQSTANTALETAQNPLAQIANGSIGAEKLADNLDLSTKTVVLPNGSVTVEMLENPLDLSGKTVVLSASLTTKKFQSADFPIAAGPILNVAHGLGAEPTIVTGYFVCIVANNGYAVGELLNAACINSVIGQDVNALAYGAGSFNGTYNPNVYATFSSQTSFSFVNKTTGADVTLSDAQMATNWKVRVCAMLLA